MQTECISGQLEFEGFDGRHVVAAFAGGAVTSDAGALLLRETDRAIRLIERVAACFSDGRDPGQLIHALPTLVGQRIVAIALGYEDVNDHDGLRFDPVLALFGDSLEAKRKDCAPLAGKSTMNRLEHAPGDGCSRYHKIGCDREALQDVFVDVFLDAHGKAPREIVLDLDATPCTATRKAGSSTAIMTVTVICRSMCSAAVSCWRQNCGARTSTPRPAPRTRWRASSPASAGAGPRYGSCSAPTPASPARS